jgi:putative transposase
VDLQFARFAAYYHAKPNRNLGRVSPADKWEELGADPRFDPSQIPGPAARREACGTLVNVDVSEEGILFKGIRYANAYTRAQRMKPGFARIAKPGERIEAIIDPMDLGAISLRVKDGFEPVPAVDDSMRGVRLADWRAGRRQQRAEAGEKRAARAEERGEARESMLENAALIARSAGVEPRRYTREEVDRKAREVRDYGKGQHEKRFIGREEYRDPVMYGFVMGGDEEDDAEFGAEDLEDLDINTGQAEDRSTAGGPGVVGAESSTAAASAEYAEAPPDPGGLDRFRSKLKPRSGGSAWQENHG